MHKTNAMSWRIGLTCLMWGGVLLCAAATARYWPESRKLLFGLSVDTALILLGMLVLVWGVGVAGWQQVTRAYGHEPVPWSTAARHLALLLLGKYLPGGFWGFSARLVDSARLSSLRSMLAAGLSEQWFGLASLTFLAALGLLSIQMQHVGLLLLAILVPVFSVCTLTLIFGSVAWVGALVLPGRSLDGRTNTGTIGNPHIWVGAVLSCVQQSLILGVVATVAVYAFGLSPAAGIAVASCYALGVAAGIVAIFMPGGIIVREMAFIALVDPWLGKEQSIALAASLRLMFTVLDLLAGALAIALNFRQGARHA